MYTCRYMYTVYLSIYSSTPQLPFKRPPIPSNRDHKPLNGGTLVYLCVFVDLCRTLPFYSPFSLPQVLRLESPLRTVRRGWCHRQWARTGRRATLAKKEGTAGLGSCKSLDTDIDIAINGRRRQKYRYGYRCGYRFRQKHRHRYRYRDEYKDRFRELAWSTVPKIGEHLYRQQYIF